MGSKRALSRSGKRSASGRKGQAGTGRSEADRKALEGRRKQAVRLFKKGELTQAEVARAVKVSRQWVSVWFKEWQTGGDQALARAGRAGRPPKLSDAELKRVERELLKGPVAHGYTTDLWTLKRVGEVIDRTTGVRYHPGHVWKILQGLEWSRQRPARRAVERDEAAIARWKEKEWPRVKKTPDAAGPGSSSKTSRASPSNPPSEPPGPRKARRRS